MEKIILRVYHDPANAWNDQTYCENCGEKAMLEDSTPGLVEGDLAVPDSICENCGKSEGEE